MEILSMLSLFFLLISSVVAKHERISSLKIHSGIRMDLHQKHVPCHGSLQTGDAISDRVSCMVKKSQLRVSKLRDKLSSSKVLSDEYESPLSAGGGDYVTTISIGTPAIEYPVIADTGSDLLWIQCKPCDDCFQQDKPIFDPSNSSSYASHSCTHDSMCQALPRSLCSSSKECTYLYTYGDGSGTRGTLASEALTLKTIEGDSMKVKNFAFGCGHLNTGNFGKSAGLVGLGRGKLSFVSQLGKLFDNKFSYCLVPWLDDVSKSSPMYFGSGAPQDSDNDPGSFQYTPMLSNKKLDTFYYVKLLDISIDGEKANIPSGTFDIKKDGSGGIIFDSGTTLTLLQDSAYDKIASILKSKITLSPVDGDDLGLELCYDTSNSDSEAKFPSVTFHFDGAEQSLPLDNYFVKSNDEGTIVCLAMASSGMDIGIIGNIQQQNFQVVYDIQNEKIGWAPTKCEEA